MNIASGRSESQQTVQECAADFLSNAFVEPVMTEVRKEAKKLLQDRNLSTLKSQTLETWRNTIEFVRNKKQNEKLAKHIEQTIIPYIESLSELTDSIFILFFFIKDKRAIYWCPNKEDVLLRLGFPYNKDEIIRGIGSVRGISAWDVSNNAETGLVGNDERLYLPNLTVLGFEENKLTYPEADWLVGNACTVYISISCQRKAKVCFCSPIVGLFGPKKINDKDHESEEFFKFFTTIIDKHSKMKFDTIVDLLLKIYDSNEEEGIKTWMYHTIGLKHKHRAEASYYDSYIFPLLNDFINIVEHHKSGKEILNILNESRQSGSRKTIDSFSKLTDTVDFLQSTTRKRKAFYEFLNHMGHRALRLEDKAKQSKDEMQADPERLLELRTFEDFEIWIRELANAMSTVNNKPFPQLEFGNPDEWLPLSRAPEKGAFEYILYQWLENAVNHGDRRRPIVCKGKVTKNGESPGAMLEFEVKNWLIKVRAEDAQSEIKSQKTCGHVSAEYFELSAQLQCEPCIQEHGQELFEHGACWDPAQTRGYGLAMIKLYVEKFYGGSTRASLAKSSEGFAVSFQLAVPLPDGAAM